MLHTNTPLHTVETHLQFCKSITNVNVCLKISQFWLGAVWSLPEVIAVAFSVLWLSRVGAGVWRLSYSTFIYYTQTKHHKTQSQSNLFLQPFLLNNRLQFPLLRFFSVKMSVLRFPKTLLLAFNKIIFFSPWFLNIRHVILPCIVIIFRAEVSAGALWCCLLLANVLQCP